jgi:hypothetical protein
VGGGEGEVVSEGTTGLAEGDVNIWKTWKWGMGVITTAVAVVAVVVVVVVVALLTDMLLHYLLVIPKGPFAARAVEFVIPVESLAEQILDGGGGGINDMTHSSIHSLDRKKTRKNMPTLAPPPPPQHHHSTTTTPSSYSIS